MINIIAPAKLNLYLHITGRREDGYHLLDSLFVFTKFGDLLSISPSNELTLTIDGPFSETIKTDTQKNLIFRAALVLKKTFSINAGAKIHLTKNIPIGSGLGGGSSDAATILKTLNTFWNIHTTQAVLADLGLTLGADIPACIYQKPSLVSGIGEIIKPIHSFNVTMPVLLVKPSIALQTPDIYKNYAASKLPFQNPVSYPVYKDALNLIEFLKTSTDNDLQTVSTKLHPDIQKLIDFLKMRPGCILARMSGSGSACFAIFKDAPTLSEAASEIKKTDSNYWIQPTEFFI